MITSHRPPRALAEPEYEIKSFVLMFSYCSSMAEAIGVACLLNFITRRLARLVIRSSTSPSFHRTDWLLPWLL